MSSKKRRKRPIELRSRETVGKMLGISRETVRRIELRALKKMRSHPIIQEIINEQAA